MVDRNPNVADKNEQGDVTAKNQDGQTEQQIMDDAQAADRTTYDIQFKCSITVEANSEEEAHSFACRYWDEHPKRTTDELNIIINLLH